MSSSRRRQRMSCWARCLGGCSGKISGEHVVSKALFANEKSITISGVPWAEGEKKVGLNSAVANILCKKHNSQLNELDTTAGRVMDSVQACLSRGESSNIQIDGRLLERWLLKTMINLGQAGWSHETNEPIESIVQHVFGLVPVPARGGMSLVLADATFDNENFLRWTVLANDETREVFGILVCIGGLQLLFSYVEEDMTALLRSMGKRDGVDHSTTDVMHHPVQISLGSPNGARSEINVRWH